MIEQPPICEFILGMIGTIDKFYGIISPLIIPYHRLGSRKSFFSREKAPATLKRS